MVTTDDEIVTEPSTQITYTDGSPVEIVPGDEAYYGPLRTIVNEALRPYGICVRFLWQKQAEPDDIFHVVQPPYAFFCRRDAMDDDNEPPAANADESAE